MCIRDRLHVDLRRPLPEARVKTIKIATRGNGVQRPVVGGLAEPLPDGQTKEG